MERGEGYLMISPRAFIPQEAQAARLYTEKTLPRPGLRAQGRDGMMEGRSACQTQELGFFLPQEPH